MKQDKLIKKRVLITVDPRVDEDAKEKAKNDSEYRSKSHLYEKAVRTLLKKE